MYDGIDAAGAGEFQYHCGEMGRCEVGGCGWESGGCEGEDEG